MKHPISSSGLASTSVDCPLAAALAARLRQSRDELVRRWLERIADRMAIHPNEVFPTGDLLDHVPLLVAGIADYVENPADEITADVPVVAKAMELGELRHAQGFDAHQILREYEVLGGVLFHFVSEAVRDVDQPCPPEELMVCAQRLFRAVAVIQQVTTTHFLRLADERVRLREEQLRGFDRALSHELKNRIGAIRGAVELLREEWIAADAAQRERFTDIIARNADEMQSVLADLLELSRIDTGEVQTRNVLLLDAAEEVARQLREFAAARDVKIHVAGDLPRVEVPGAAFELCLSNYLSNAVKYRDPAKSDSWVRVEGRVERNDEGCEVVVSVWDNGLGVPEEVRPKLFDRFFRAHDQTATGEEGTGLGLAIVRETVESVGGRAWAEFPDGGETVFWLALPCAERDDAPAP